MTAGTTTLGQAHLRGFELVEAHTDRFLRYVSDLAPDDLDRPVPGMEWSVRELIAHVRSVYERFTIDRRRAATTAGVARQNAEDIARLGTDIDRATGSIRAQIAAMAARVETMSPDQTYTFHLGQPAALAAGWGNLLGELLAHGDDLARATGRPFGLPGQDLEISWRHAIPLLNGWLRPHAATLDESWDLRFGFGTLRYTIRHGRFQASTEPPRAIHRSLDIDDAATCTLSFPYRRRAITDPGLALLASRFYDL